MDKVLIIGTSGHAKVVIDIIENEGKYEIYGLIDTFKEVGDSVYGYKILGTEKDIAEIILENKIIGGFIAIGDNWSRHTIFKHIIKLNSNFKFISIIHSNTSIGKNVQIGNGTVVMPGAVINADSVVGDFCIVNTLASLDHESTLQDFASLGPGANISGNVSIGAFTAISLGAKVIENIEIKSHTIVGAGAVVLKNIESHKVVYGVPAKEIRDRKEGEKYLGKNQKNISVKTNESYSFKCNTIKTKKDIEVYNSFLKTFNQDTIFYSYEYIYQKNEDLKYLLLSKDNVPVALMPFSLSKSKNSTDYYDISTPYGYSGPLFSLNISEACINLFWNKVDKWHKENNVITEFIRFNLTMNHKYYNGRLLSTLNNVKGKITDFESIWTSFKKKVRNNYRKSEQFNLKIIIHSKDISDETIQSFYDIYIKTMNRNEAAENYYYPISYFINLIKNRKENTLIALVFKDEIAISAELIIINNNVLYSYLGGTLSEYFQMRPNDFLKIEVIKWAITNNISYYILGGGRSNGDALYQYKKSFFPKDEDAIFYTGRKVINPNIYLKMVNDLNIKSDDINDLISDSNTFFPIYNKTI